jgi:hypothetical protein
MKDQQWVDLGQSLFKKYYKDPPEEMNVPLTALTMTIVPIMQQTGESTRNLEREVTILVKHLFMAVFTMGYEKAISRDPKMRANVDFFRQVFATISDEKLKECLGEDLFVKLKTVRANDGQKTQAQKEKAQETQG